MNIFELAGAARRKGATRGPLTLSAADAWKVMKPELSAATVDIWSDEDFLDEPSRHQMLADMEDDVISPDILEEIENKMDADWCAGKVLDAALVLLAEHGRLDRFSPDAVMTRRPKTKVINGVRYIIG